MPLSIAGTTGDGISFALAAFLAQGGEWREGLGWELFVGIMIIVGAAALVRVLVSGAREAIENRLRSQERADSPLLGQGEGESSAASPYKEAARGIVGTGKKYGNDLVIVEDMVVERGLRTHRIPIALIAEVRASSGWPRTVQIRTRTGQEYHPNVSRKMGEEFTSDVKAIQSLARDLVALACRQERV